MKKITILTVAAFLAASTFIACNSDTPTYEDEVISNVGVASFKLAENDSVLANLDTIYFTIDLDKALIYNADSLPCGTRTDTLVPVISMMSQVSKADIKYTKKNGNDTVVDYLENQKHVINFSDGPVYFTVASANGLLERTYTIKVNVHQLKSDSLTWGETSRTALPTLLSDPIYQRTVRTADATYCLTSNGMDVSMAKRADATVDWEIYSVTLPAGARINDFAAADDALYIIANGNALYTSIDGGSTWTETGMKMSHIYGCYGTRLLGAIEDADVWYTTEYPAGTRTLMPKGMPIEGTSTMFSYTFELGTSPISSFIGGRDSEDNLSGASWAFDGETWACVSTKPIPGGYMDMTYVPFFAFNVNSVYVATKYSIFMAFGGTDGDLLNPGVYVSSDYGRTWKLGANSIQLPDNMPLMSNAQGYVENHTITDDMARATKPITEWECPYIYLYGGEDSAGKLSEYVWRGTINRLTFKPVI